MQTADCYIFFGPEVEKILSPNRVFVQGMSQFGSTSLRAAQKFQEEVL